MSLSPNTAQMRELGELRNHLKWLDEERRKSTRKMAELEQRMAQQGRDLAERDQKITELERHIANFNERFERMPETPAVAADAEQRLQDLEWHVSSMNTVLSRVPSAEDEQRRRQEEETRRQEEQAYLQEEIARAISATHERMESSQSMLEAQIRSELATIRESDDRLSLVSQLEHQAGEISTLREAVFELSGRLRETTESFAADSQSSMNALAQSVQNHMDVLSTELHQKVDGLSAEVDLKLADLPDRSIDLSPDITRLDERFDEVAGLQRAWESRLNQLEQNIDKLGNVRELMPVIDRLEQELELRQAEELRLANLLAAQEERFMPLSATVEDLGITNTTLNNRLMDSEKTIQELAARVRDMNDNLKPVIDEANRRVSPLVEKVTALTNSAIKTEAGLQAISSDHLELRNLIVDTTDELQRQQNDITRQLEGWQVTMDENKDTIERFTQQWLTLSNQYKEARMAVQNFAHWQKQLEQQKREASEMLRLESNRMQARWDGFILEVQEKLKNFEIDFGQKWQTYELENEQKWSSARRSEKLWREEISAVDDLIQKLQQDNRNLIWRVQNAQADAIKKWPRLLMEEVEKAVEINPNRRLTSVTAAPSSEMSVVDAIEQGLITIDYNDETEIDD